MGDTGRPSKIDQVVRIAADGTAVTAGDHIIQRIRLGLDLQSAADSSGVSRRTLHNWRLTGARHRAEQAQGRRLTRAHGRFVEFLDALESAESDAEATRLAHIAQAALPQTVTRVTVKTQLLQQADGSWATVEVERSTTTETRPGAWQADAWWLERRLPKKYARRYELTGAEGTPLIPAEDRARSIADSARLFLEGAGRGRRRRTRGDHPMTLSARRTGGGD